MITHGTTLHASATKTNKNTPRMYVKLEQALAVRVLDRLVAGADEDAFESGKIGTSEDECDRDTTDEQAGNQIGPNRSIGGSAKMNRRRSSASDPVSVSGVGGHGRSVVSHLRKRVLSDSRWAANVVRIVLLSGKLAESPARYLEVVLVSRGVQHKQEGSFTRISPETRSGSSLRR